MSATTINGVTMDERIAQNLAFLQIGYGVAIAEGLDVAIGYLLEVVGIECDDPKKLLDVLSTLHNARTLLLGIIPEEKGGAQ